MIPSVYNINIVFVYNKNYKQHIYVWIEKNAPFAALRVGSNNNFHDWKWKKGVSLTTLMAVLGFRRPACTKAM